MFGRRDGVLRKCVLRYLFIKHASFLFTLLVGHELLGDEEGASAGTQPMKPSFSPFWDRLVRRALRERNPDPLRDGRRIEMMVMGLVQCPERIQLFFDGGHFEDLAYLAEYVRAGVPPVIALTDPVLFRNLTRGMARLRALGWDQRLKPGPLRIRAAAKRRRESA